MSMSKDRVKFRLYANAKDLNAVIDAAVRAFGITRQQARDIAGVHRVYGCDHPGGYIICRPSQFARFIIYRAEKVEVNQIAMLDAKLIPAHVPTELDVSCNPASEGDHTS